MQKSKLSRRARRIVTLEQQADTMTTQLLAEWACFIWKNATAGCQ